MMSRWVERILGEFPSELSRLWIAADPDDVLLDEQVLATLRSRGFEVLPFEDSVAFRVEYEERYRGAWDRGERGSAQALVLHLRNGATDDLPWDYLREGRRVSLSLADLFPKLSYGVVRQIGSEYLEALFDAHSKHAVQSLGEVATKDFILTHIFGLSPYLISGTEALWRELMRLHFSDKVLPPVLANHVVKILEGQASFRNQPLDKLFSSKGYFLRLVQDAWEQFLARHRVTGPATEAAVPLNGETLLDIPFEHPDVRVLVDSMFLDGLLQPVPLEGTAAGIPDWARVGIIEDPEAMAKLVAESASRLDASLPAIDASHREWVQASRRLGELIFRFHTLAPGQADPVGREVLNVQMAVDQQLREWVVAHYEDLPSLPVASGPVMLHHVPRFLSLRRGAGEDRVALLLFDGMAMDQWIQVRDHLTQQVPKLVFEESACFAWLPTLTSVSRQALFSGLKPREFASSIETTAQEPALWSRFWQDHGLTPREVLFQKGIKRTQQLAQIEAAIGDPAVKAAGIVVDTIDEIVHGAIFGKRGLAGQISSWCESGFIERLFTALLSSGFHVYATADHGNVDAIGVGRLNQGVAAEVRGERVRVYRSEAMAKSIPDDIDAFRLGIGGLPSDFLPLFAGGRGAFVTHGQQIVSHGGLSVEELIVPFVKVSLASAKK
jgi:hypothetical protein